VKGGYKGMAASRAYEIRLPGDWPPAALNITRPNKLEGSVHWRYEGNTLTTVIPVVSTDVRDKVTLHVVRMGDLASRRSLNGFAGAMTRLREAYDELNQTFPIAWSPDELVDAMQTGDRLSYFPQQAGEQLAHYREVLPAAIAKVHQLEKPPSETEVAALARRFHVEPDSELARRKVTEFKQHVVRAEAALADLPSGK